MGTTIVLMLAAAFLAVMVLGAYIVEQYKLRTKKVDAANYAAAESINAELKALYIAENNRSDHRRFSPKSSYAFEKLWNTLKLRFGENLTVHSEACSIWEKEYTDAGEEPHKSCSTIFGIKSPSGVAFISLSYFDDSSKWHKPYSNFPKWELVGDDLSEYSDKTIFKHAANLEIISPNDQLLNELLELIDSSKLQMIDRPQDEKVGTRVEHFTVQKRRGEVTLSPISRSIVPVPDKLLDASYNDVPIEYEGKKFNVSMSKAMGIITDVFLKNGENISIFGKMGCGKTHLADEIGRRLGARFGNVVIYLTPQMISELQSSEFMSQLLSSIKELEETYGQALRPIFIVDEAEQLLKTTDDGIHSSVASYMLSTMDGMMQKVMNCSFVLTFNCDKSLLNPAAFREGRMGLEINVTPISQEKATIVVDELKVRNAHLYFDEGKWNNIRQKDELSLASIYACFAPKGKRRLIKQALIEMGYIQDDAPKPTPPPSSATPVAPSPSNSEVAPRAPIAPPLQPSKVNPNPNPQQNKNSGSWTGKKRRK